MSAANRPAGGWLPMLVILALLVGGAALYQQFSLIHIQLGDGARYQGPLVPTLPAGFPTYAPQTTGRTPAGLPHLTPGGSYQRAGFGVAIPAPPGVWASRLGASWYLDWAANPEIAPALGYWKMIRVLEDGYTPSLRKIAALAVAEPGRVWIIGNEPDVVWQDDQTPEAYARAYHELYTTLKAYDPSALVAVGGISQATPLRLAYLDRVLDAYQASFGQQLPADWWTVHGFVLREEKDSWGVGIPPGIDAEQGVLYEISDHGRLDHFEDQLRAFRAWMAGRGYQNVPLALTEFGILMPPEYGYPPEMVSQYLRDTFQLLQALRDPEIGLPADDHRLVQQWAWFSLFDPSYPASNLADFRAVRLTAVGEAFRDFVETMK